MGLINKLFGDTSNDQIKQKNTIFDFFKTDLKSVPNDTFIKGEFEENTSRKSLQNYRKKLEEKECGGNILYTNQSPAPNLSNITYKVVGENINSTGFQNLNLELYNTSIGSSTSCKMVYQ